MSEMNPNEEVPYVGNESDQTRNEIRKDSEMNPIYPTSKHTTTNISVYKKFDLSSFDDFEIAVAIEAIDYRKVI